MNIIGEKVVSTTFCMGIQRKEGKISSFVGEDIKVMYNGNESKYTIDSFLSSVDKKILSVSADVYEYLKKIKEENDVKNIQEKHEKVGVGWSTSIGEAVGSYKDTFLFKYESVYYQGISGFAVYSTYNEKIGLVWKHRHKKGELAEGQAEILFFDEYNSKYNKWRRIFKNGIRVMYDDFISELRARQTILMTIDEQRKI